MDQANGKFDKGIIDERFSKLVGAGADTGPRAIMFDLLTDPAMPGSMSGVDANAKLNDPEFVKRMQVKVVESLVTRKLQSGKMNEQQARRVIESDWGKDMINKAIVNKKNIKGQMDALKQSGALGGFGEWMKKKSGGNALMFLALILGTVATVGILPGMITLSDSLKK